MNEVIECYVRIVKSGRMKLEDIPDRYRKAVEEIINGESNHDKR